MDHLISTKKHYHFFKNVTIKLGHSDWRVRFCHDNYCWIKDKRIDIDMDYHGDIRQIILHEIAHIDTAKYCNQKHTPSFWKHLKDLNVRFLNGELDENQKRHMEYMSSGYYSIKYK